MGECTTKASPVGLPWNQLNNRVCLPTELREGYYGGSHVVMTG